MQGKTNQFQCLDAQPRFADMLDRCTKVQFNQNAKQRISMQGAKVKASNKRKNLAFAFKKNEMKNGSYPEDYATFKREQIEGYKEGVLDAQKLFSNYVPANCVNMLKKCGYWEKPYTFKNPQGCVLVSEPPSISSHNLLEVSFASVSKGIENPGDINELEDLGNEAQPNEEGNNDSMEPEQDEQDLSICDEDDNFLSQKETSKWKITKLENGKVNFISVTRALKILIPREYISRDRRKRHWSSKYLPGKEPLNPLHDVYRYCNVALKATRQGKQITVIARIEAIESILDGKDMVSFQLKPEGKTSSSSVRIRCSPYSIDSDREIDVYYISDRPSLTQWKSPSSILCVVDLIQDPDCKGKFTLATESKQLLETLVKSPKSNDTNPCSSVDDNYFAVEDVIGRRISKDTLTYEYKARFEGYGPEYDMWLPASFFNRPIDFVSTSKFGRKRRHTLTPNVPEEAVKKEGKSSKLNKERVPIKTDEGDNEIAIRTKKKKTVSVKAEKLDSCKNNTSKKKGVKARVCKKDKGRVFRSNLKCSETHLKNKKKEDHLNNAEKKALPMKRLNKMKF